MTQISFVKLSSNECHWALMISQHWFRSWLGAVRQQAITWANVDSDQRHHMVSPPGHSGLIHVHILQVSPLFSCNDACQILMLYVTGNSVSVILQNYKYYGAKEICFYNCQPRLCFQYCGKVWPIKKHCCVWGIFPSLVDNCVCDIDNLFTGQQFNFWIVFTK